MSGINESGRKAPQQIIWMVLSIVLIISILIKNDAGIAICIILGLSYQALKSFVGYKETKAKIELVKMILCVIAAAVFTLYYAIRLV